jgi:hypothetical protein
MLTYADVTNSRREQLAEKEQQFAHESRMLSDSNARVRAELELSHQVYFLVLVTPVICIFFVLVK